MLPNTTIDPFVRSWQNALLDTRTDRTLLPAVLRFLPRKELHPNAVNRATYDRAEAEVLRISRAIARLAPNSRATRTRLDRELYYAMAWLEATRIAMRAVEPGWVCPAAKRALPENSRAYYHILRARLRKARNPAIHTMLSDEDAACHEAWQQAIARRDAAYARAQIAKDTAAEAQALRRQMVRGDARTPRELTAKLRAKRAEWKEAVRVCKLAEAKATAARKALAAYRRRITNLEDRIAALVIV
jgi:hypothetical protein